MAAVGILLAANVVVPALWGDVYPFTSAPMFRNAPVQCCQYRFFDAEGRELAAEDWLVHRVYDGNPVGYGVGVQPPAILEQEYGVVHDEAAVKRHMEGQFARPVNRGQKQVEVEQTVLGAVDEQRVGIVRTSRWLVRHRTSGD
jgi:hypothetical protein